MKTLYLDCFAGIAGDMFIGALLNFVPKEVLINSLRKIHGLNPDEYELIIERVTKNSIAGINFDVKLHEHSHDSHHEHDHHDHRHLSDIEHMISSSDLPLRVKRESLRAFSILAEAEANVHGTTPDKIHFHEVGAVDSIIDIIGAFVLIDAMNYPRILCSPVNVGHGTVKCAHGILPVPAPATEFLLRGIPVFSDSDSEPMERTTPTGALLVKILADGFSSVPAGKILGSGFGFGNRESQNIPNALRALLIDSEIENSDGLVHEKLALLECNIDDMNPQDYEISIEKLFRAKALDVWLENIAMKKNRPGVKLCCLSNPDDAKKFCKIILENTTSQGVRIHELERMRLNWKIERVKFSLGEIDVKCAYLGEKLLRRTPEYDDLKNLAAKNNLTIQELRNIFAREIS